MARVPVPHPPDDPAGHAVTVVGASWITPRTRRLVFAADRLAEAFATPAGAHAPYLKLVLGSAERPVVRTYSIRRLDPARDELHVDFVLHEDEGPGSAFGRTAGPGTPARLRGPGHLGIAPCRHHRLAADHCGLPALAHLLEHLPADATGTAVVEIPDATEIQHLRAPAALAVEWIVRPAGARSRLAHRILGEPSPTSAETLVWAGAEAGIARPIRRAARGPWGVPSPRCQVLNYWRLGRPEGSFSFIA